jgi:hypothetical protein
MTRSWETIVTRRQTSARTSKHRSRFGASAWLLSLVVHGAILAALGLTIPHTPQGAGDGAGGGGIVLTAQFGGRSPSYLDEAATSRFTLANAAPALIEIAPSPVPRSGRSQTRLPWRAQRHRRATAQRELRPPNTTLRLPVVKTATAV